MQKESIFSGVEARTFTFHSLPQISLVALLLIGSLFFSSSHSFAQKPLGTDVSGYQPATINWAPATNGGVRFAWSKATEGTGYVNPNFVGQVNGAVAAKVYIGAYHYARPGLHPNLTGANSADSEAQAFWTTAGPYIKNGGQFLMPMLDWEDVGSGAWVSNGMTTAKMSAWVNEWCNAVSNYANANGVHINPVVYTGTWYSTPNGQYPGLDSSVTGHPNNMSGYPSNPNPQTGQPSTYPWASFTFWQYADTNWTGGDSDVYNGTLTNLVQNFVIGGNTAPRFDGPPANQFVAAGTPATFTVTTGGLTPMYYRWQFNGSTISGATSSNYTVSYVQPSNVGSYVCIASNSIATVTSAPAYVTILTNPPGSVPGPSTMVDWYGAEGTPADYVSPYTGSPYTATLNGGVTYVAGERGKAFHFDGSTGYLYTGAPSLFVPWTACMWVNREQSSATASAIMGDGFYELKLEQYSNTYNVGFTIFGVNDYNFGYTIPQNTWTHLAFVASGSQMQLYANGALVGTIATNCPCPRSYIGASYYFNTNSSRVLDYMKGSLDEVQMFGRALSSSEISSIYNAGSGGLVNLPVIVSKIKNSPTQFRIVAQGLSGEPITVWSSPDMVNWGKLTVLSYFGGNLTYTDTHATPSQMFYRLTQP